MLTPKPKPIDATLEILVAQMLDMRDALIEASLALQDYQFALDSAERQSAQCLARHWIERAQICGNADTAGPAAVAPRTAT